MEQLFAFDNLVALLTLLALEIVLGIDNVIFIAILSSKLPVDQQARARTTGIALAVITRILLLFGISWIMGLDKTPIFTLFGNALTGRDLILLIGGIFLIGKSTYEIHEKLEAAEHSTATKAMATFAAVIAQIVLIDIVFSLDSVITAVGISNHIEIMVIAVVIAAVVMLTFAGSISGFVEKHPTMKVLALSFLILIGSMLVIEGWDHDAAEGLHLKNYAYFAMAFSFLVELINLRVRKHTKDPVQLHNQPSLHQLELATTPVAVGAGAPGVTVATAKPTNAARPRPAGKQRKKR